jgi:glutathione S-transferase
MSSVIVYGTRLSPFVEKVARALEWKRVPFEIVEPKGPGDLRKFNPVTGKMPAVSLDGELLYDSTFILRALDARHPDPPLLSADARVAAAQRQLEDWADESLYWYLMALRWADPNAAATADQILSSVPALLRPILRIVVRRKVGGMARSQGLGRLPHEVVVRELGRILDDLVVLLGDRTFFYADEPSLADLAVYAQIQMGLSGPTPEVEVLVADRPALTEFQKRVEEAAR